MQGCVRKGPRKAGVSTKKIDGVVARRAQLVAHQEHEAAARALRDERDPP